MSERDLNRRLMNTFKQAGFDPQRVENVANPGCPDIEFVGGWVESKWLRRWPKKAALTVRLDHFTSKQRAWHVRRAVAGGKSWVVLEAFGEILIFDGMCAASNLGWLPRGGLEKVALLHLDGYHTDVISEWFKEQTR